MHRSSPSTDRGEGIFRQDNNMSAGPRLVHGAAKSWLMEIVGESVDAEAGVGHLALVCEGSYIYNAEEFIFYSVICKVSDEYQDGTGCLWSRRCKAEKCFSNYMALWRWDSIHGV